MMVPKDSGDWCAVCGLCEREGLIRRPVTVLRALWSGADRDWLWVPPVSTRVSPRLPGPPARGAAESRGAPLRPCECEFPGFTWHRAVPVPRGGYIRLYIFIYWLKSLYGRTELVYCTGSKYGWEAVHTRTRSDESCCRRGFNQQERARRHNVPGTGPQVL